MKLKILLVEPNKLVADCISKNLSQEFGAEIMGLSSSQSATPLLKKGHPFNLFLVRNFYIDQDTGTKDNIAECFVNTFYDQEIKSPLIVMGPFEHSLKIYTCIAEKLRIEELNRTVLKKLELKKEDFDYLKLPDFISYPLKYFSFFTKSPCDVFVRLSKKTGDDFAVRIKKEEPIGRELIKTYQEAGVLELYIGKVEREFFLTQVISEMMRNVSKPSKTADEGVSVVGESYNLSSELIKSMGITPATVGLVNQTIKELRQQILRADKLAPLIRKMFDNEMGLAYRRAYFICLLAHQLIPKMEWGGGEQQQLIFEKISMVSFFHDIYLEDEKLLKIMNQAQLKAANLTPEEKDLVTNHAHRAALMVQTYPRLSQGIDLIIKQHHGVGHGVGFPEQFSSSLSPLVIFFIVVEDFVTHCLVLGGLSQFPKMMEILRERYQLPSYRKVLQEIENLFKAPRSN